MTATFKTLTFLFLSAFIITSCNSDDSMKLDDSTNNDKLIVNIPDSAFKSLLISNSNINTNGDNEIQKTEATAYTGSINGDANNIKNIDGIEYFINLTELYLDGNSIENVDFSKNTELISLQITGSVLTSIDLSMNTKLDYADLENNQLSTVDVSNCTELTSLYLSGNQLATIDVSKNTILKELTLYDNELTTIDISDNTALITLNLTENKLTSVNISTNTDLQYLHLSKNQLTTVNVSRNTKLKTLNLFDNKLFSAFLANGNNNNLNICNLTDNPNLSCIEVDALLVPNTWKKDNATIYSLDCSD